MIPPIRVTDQLSLKAREYAVRLKGIEISRFELLPGCELAVSGRGSAPAGGIPTREPAFGLAGYWVPSEKTEEARRAGWTVVDPLSVLSTHLTELLRRHAWEIFNRQEAKKLLDRVGEENPRVVEDLVPKLLPLATVQKILQNLLRERVSIRDSASILEAMSEAAALTRNPVLMTEYIRQSQRRALVQPFLDPQGQLPAFLLDPGMEKRMDDASEHGEASSQFHLAPEPMREILDAAERTLGEARAPVAALTGSSSRYFLRQLLEGKWPNVSVLAHGEVPPGVRVIPLSVIGGGNR
jgi:flagellar biosynthesis protein FlhA